MPSLMGRWTASACGKCGAATAEAGTVRCPVSGRCTARRMEAAPRRPPPPASATPACKAGCGRRARTSCGVCVSLRARQPHYPALTPCFYAQMRRRYCLIEGTRLRYSAEGPGAGKDAPQAWKGEIDLQAVRPVPRYGGGEPASHGRPTQVLSVNATSGGGEGRRRALYRFQLRTAGRVWNLAAELETDRAMWIKELRRVLA